MLIALLDIPLAVQGYKAEVRRDGCAHRAAPNAVANHALRSHVEDQLVADVDCCAWLTPFRLPQKVLLSKY